jgi:hypothetical protein
MPNLAETFLVELPEKIILLRVSDAGAPEEDRRGCCSDQAAEGSAGSTETSSKRDATPDCRYDSPCSLLTKSIGCAHEGTTYYTSIEHWTICLTGFEHFWHDSKHLLLSE